MSSAENVPMRVAAVMVDPETDAPVLILRAMYDPSIYLPIFVGQVEAASVAAVIAGIEMPRPMTHDLVINLLSVTGWGLEKMTITRVEDKTFYAELLITDLDGLPQMIDCRPSDGIALALRAGAKIWVSQEVLDEAGGHAPEGEVQASEEEVDALLGSGDSPLDGRTPAVTQAYGADTDLAEWDPEEFSKYKM